MEPDLKRLAYLSLFFCLPVALFGFYLYKTRPVVAIFCFRFSAFFFFFAWCITAVFFFGLGGQLVPALGSFY